MDQLLNALMVLKARLQFVFPTDPLQETKTAWEKKVSPEKVGQEYLCQE